MATSIRRAKSFEAIGKTEEHKASEARKKFGVKINAFDDYSNKYDESAAKTA
ncbi:hypothetical protein [Bacillus sp. 1P02SD]|uniref:hypothetical protein n=1 Tax=Bacillus sp. 1P02SD TaxID=3132264 RepID=UPI0039A16ECE